MKNLSFLFLLLIGVLMLTPARVSAMMEPNKSEGEKKSKEADLDEEVARDTKAARDEAVIKESKEEGNPDFRPTGVIERTISARSEEVNTSQANISVNFPGESEPLEEENLFDLGVLEQRLQEARKVVAELTRKGPTMGEEELEKLFQEWSEKWEHYQQAEFGFFNLKKSSNMFSSEQQLLETKLEELLQHSQETLLTIVESLEVFSNKTTRLGGPFYSEREELIYRIKEKEKETQKINKICSDLYLEIKQEEERCFKQVVQLQDELSIRQYQLEEDIRGKQLELENETSQKHSQVEKEIRKRHSQVEEETSLRHCQLEEEGSRRVEAHLEEWQVRLGLFSFFLGLLPELLAEEMGRIQRTLEGEIRSRHEQLERERKERHEQLEMDGRERHEQLERDWRGRHEQLERKIMEGKKQLEKEKLYKQEEVENWWRKRREQLAKEMVEKRSQLKKEMLERQVQRIFDAKKVKAQRTQGLTHSGFTTAESSAPRVQKQPMLLKRQEEQDSYLEEDLQDLESITSPRKLTEKPAWKSSWDDSSSLVKTSIEEGSDDEYFFDPDTLERIEQKIKEAQEVLSYLAGQGLIISAQEIRDLYQKWSHLYHHYGKALSSAIEDGNSDKEKQQKLEKLELASYEVVEELRNFLSVSNETTCFSSLTNSRSYDELRNSRSYDDLSPRRSFEMKLGKEREALPVNENFNLQEKKEKFTESKLTEQITKVNEMLGCLDGAYEKAIALSQKAKQTRINRHAKDRWSEAALGWKGLLEQIQEIASMNEGIKIPAAVSLLSDTKNQKLNAHRDVFSKNEEITQLRLIEAKLRYAESQAQACFYEAQLVSSEQEKHSSFNDAVNALSVIDTLDLRNDQHPFGSLITSLHTSLQAKRTYYEALCTSSEFAMAKKAALSAPLERKEELWAQAKNLMERAQVLWSRSAEFFKEGKSKIESVLREEWEELLTEIEEAKEKLAHEKIEKLKERDLRQATFQQKALSKKSSPAQGNSPLGKKEEKPVITEEPSSLMTSQIPDIVEEEVQKLSPKFQELAPQDHPSDWEKSAFPSAWLLEATPLAPLESAPWKKRVVRILELPGDKGEPRYLRIEELSDGSVVVERKVMYADKLIIQFEKEVDPSELARRMQPEVAVKEIKPLSLTDVYYQIVLGDHAADALEKAQHKIKEISLAVRSCYPNYLDKSCMFFSQDSTSDSYSPEQWNLAKIQVEAGWKSIENLAILTKEQSPVIGILDEGIRASHRGLKGNFYHENNVPIGFDGFDKFPQKQLENLANLTGHGTKCAGVIGALFDNEEGIAGVAWKVRLLVCKVAERLDQRGCPIADTAARTRALHSVLNKIQDLGKLPILNYSYELNDPYLFYDVVKGNAAHSIIVRAAGNEGKNNDLEERCHQERQAYDKVLIVGATTPEDRLASFSHYGPSTVDIVAPGVSIRTTGASSDQDYVSGVEGTSFAAPHAAGALSLMSIQFPEEEGYDGEYLLNRLLATTDKLPQLKNKTIAGRLNVARALDQGVPEEILENWKEISVLQKSFYKNFSGLYAKQRMVYHTEENTLHFAISAFHKDVDSIYAKAHNVATAAKSKWDQFVEKYAEESTNPETAIISNFAAYYNLEGQVPNYYEKAHEEALGYQATWENNIQHLEHWWELEEERREIERRHTKGPLPENSKREDYNEFFQKIENAFRKPSKVNGLFEPLLEQLRRYIRTLS